MKGSSAQTSDELNANSIIKIKKSDLDKLLKSFSKQKSDLESLQEKVESQKNECKNIFTKLNGSLIYKHGQYKGKPFEITLQQIRQLADTSVGYALQMLKTFDMTQQQLDQAEKKAQDTMNMEQSMMQS